MTNVKYLEVPKSRQQTEEPELTPGFDDAHLWPRALEAEEPTSGGAKRREWSMVGIGLAALIAVLVVLFVVWSVAVS
jgi:hypothetical protein